MAQHTGESIPKACGSWAEVMGAYRLLSNDQVTPDDLQTPHRGLARKACAELPVVLAVSDITYLDFTSRKGISGLGCIGHGAGRGLKQYTTLAVAPEGEVLGVLWQHWIRHDRVPKSETRRQRYARWCVSDIWSDGAEAIGTIEGCRVIHVADREADVFVFMDTCFKVGVGFLVRASQDRNLAGEDARLWEHVATQKVIDRFDVPVSRHQSWYRREQRVARTAKVSLRTARVMLPPPPQRRDKRIKESSTHEVYAIHVLEEHPPNGEQIVPLEWMLLTSERVESAADARRMVQWYTRRWVIEEFHRAEKEGCRLEATQLDTAEDIERLAAITAVSAVRLLQLRDAADPASPQADNPKALRGTVDRDVLRVVSIMTGIAQCKLTPTQLLTAIAKRGGWLGRKNDPRPGWKCIWRGWHDITLMAAGARLFASESS